MVSEKHLLEPLTINQVESIPNLRGVSQNGLGRIDEKLYVHLVEL